MMKATYQTPQIHFLALSPSPILGVSIEVSNEKVNRWDAPRFESIDDDWEEE